MAFDPATAKPVSGKFDPSTAKPVVQPQIETPDFETEAQQIAGTTPAEAIAGNPVTRLALGAASPIIGAIQLGAHNPIAKALGQADWIDSKIAQLEEMKQKGMKAQDLEGFDWSGLLGTMASPAFLKIAKAIPAAETYLGKIFQGTSFGAGAGMTAPVAEGDFAGQKAAQTATGAAIGGVVSGALPIVKGLGNVAYHGLIEPWANPAAIKGRAYLQAAGDKVDDIIAFLKQAREIVPGSKPTAGEAAVPAGRAEFSALQQSASKVKPTEYLARADEQNAARLAQIRTVGKNEAALQSAKGQRAADASANYGAAETQVIQSDKGLEFLMSRPSMSKVLARAKDLAAEKGDVFQIGQNAPAKNVPGAVVGANGQPLTSTTIPAQTAAFPVKSLHYVKMAMDDLIKNPERFGIGASEAKAIEGTQKGFVGWLGNKSLAYDTARQTYARQSKPINQMEIGQELERKLVPALDTEASQKAGVYAQALRESKGLIKKATGQPRYDSLTEILDPAQMKAVNSVRDDLARASRFGLQARKGAQAAPNAVDLATANLEQIAGGKVPNLLNRIAMVTNAIIDRLQGKIDKKLAGEIAVEMLSPSGVAKSMEQAAANAKRSAYLAKKAREIVLPMQAGITQDVAENLK